MELILRTLSVDLKNRPLIKVVALQLSVPIIRSVIV